MTTTTMTNLQKAFATKEPRTKRFYKLVVAKDDTIEGRTIQGRMIATSHDLEYLLSLREYTMTWDEAKAFYKNVLDLDLFYKYPCSAIVVYKSYSHYKKGAAPIRVKGLCWW